MKIQGKRILITGASGGIGEACAKDLASRGAGTVLVARRLEELKRVQKKINSSYEAKAEILAADICKAADRQKITEYLKKSHKPLDVLVHNAGITAHGRFEDAHPEVLRKTMELNFFAAVELTALVLPLLKQNQGRKGIVLVSTPSGLHGIPQRFAYSASKAAGHAWLETLRVELKEYSIFTSIYCPGYTRTNLRTNGIATDGSSLNKEQEKGAHSAAKVARRLSRVIQKEKRIALMDLNGFAVYGLRTLAPGLLDWLLKKKLN